MTTILPIIAVVVAVLSSFFSVYLAKRYGRIGNTDDMMVKYWENVRFALLGALLSWIGVIITYLIVRPKKDEQRCPHCHKVIPLAAIKCRFCGFDLESLPGRLAP